MDASRIYMTSGLTWWFVIGKQNGRCHKLSKQKVRWGNFRETILSNTQRNTTRHGFPGETPIPGQVCKFTYAAKMTWVRATSSIQRGGVSSLFPGTSYQVSKSYNFCSRRSVHCAMRSSWCNKPANIHGRASERNGIHVRCAPKSEICIQ